MKQNVHNWRKENLGLNTVSVKHTPLLQFTFHNMTTLQFLLIFLGTGLEVVIVVWINNAAWVRTPYSLVHGYECFGGEFWMYIYRPLKDGNCISRC